MFSLSTLILHSFHPSPFSLHSLDLIISTRNCSVYPAFTLQCTYPSLCLHPLLFSVRTPHSVFTPYSSVYVPLTLSSPLTLQCTYPSLCLHPLLFSVRTPHSVFTPYSSMYVPLTLSSPLTLQCTYPSLCLHPLLFSVCTPHS